MTLAAEHEYGIYAKTVKNNPEYKERRSTCIVVGYGPAGIFSTYRLIEAGYKVIVFEKGKRIIERQIDVERFFNDGALFFFC